MGPPDYVRVEQGSEFFPDELKEKSEACGIELLHEPMENPCSVTHVEGYHGLEHTAFEMLERFLPNRESAELLQMAVHCVNSTVGPEELCPTLCVFLAVPRPACSVSAPDQLARAEASAAALDATPKNLTQRRNAFVRKYRSRLETRGSIWKG